MSVDHTSRKHALLSASGASRWINCTPSARLEEDFEEDRSSSYANEGTLAHEFGELGLRVATKVISKRKYNSEAKKLREHELYSDEMESEVQKYIDYVLEAYNVAKHQANGATLLIEEKVDLTEFIDEGFGTCDANIVADNELNVIDLKYGKGIKVEAEKNNQLMLYGLGALMRYELSYDIEIVTLTIVQPRLDHISTWSISVEDLVNWGEEIVRPKATLAYAGEGTQCAGEWCRWCKAQAKCRTLSEKHLALAKHDFAEPMLLTDEELLEAYELMPGLSSWVASVSAHLLREALNGKNWDGYKVVEGRSVRQWVDPSEVAKALTSEGFTADKYTNTKLKGIGDVEKLVGKKNFPTILGDLVHKPQGKPALVPMSDKRSPFVGVSSADEDFAK